MTDIYKTCVKCLLQKPITNFYKKSRGRGKTTIGYHSWCKNCCCNNDRELKTLDPERRYKRDRKNSLNYRSHNREKQMFFGARRRSKKYNIPFSIELEDIIIPEFCPVLGIRLESNFGKGSKGRGHRNSPSLDRIKPELGYIKSNIQVISNRANALKSDSTIEELQKIIQYMSSNR